MLKNFRVAQMQNLLLRVCFKASSQYFTDHTKLGLNDVVDFPTSIFDPVCDSHVDRNMNIFEQGFSNLVILPSYDNYMSLANNSKHISTGKSTKVQIMIKNNILVILYFLIIINYI